MAHSAVNNFFLQEHIMKRKVLLLLVLATLVAGGAFAQKVGDTVDFYGKKYDVKEMKDGRVVLQLAPTLDGTWSTGDGDIVITITGNTSVIKKIPTNVALVKSAVDKGHVKVGSTPWYRNITKKSDGTWSAQVISIEWKTNAPDVAIGTNSRNCTIKLSADGKTLTDNYNYSFIRQ
jgi:hypothetical protein